MRGRFADISGQRFNRLQVLWPAGRRGNLVMWACQCDCGATMVVRGGSLKSGNTQSCGCLNREFAHTRALKHGQSYNGKRSPEYISFHNAKKRCNNPNDPKWPSYGGRGIEFRFRSFQDFLAEVGRRPEPKDKYSIDRINNDGHYEPGNVRWATAKEQMNNRRVCHAH